MLDAEIAATLPNRWDRKPAPAGNRSPLDLLQEGKLHYTQGRGEFRVRDEDGPATNGLHIECLTFTDGSRALGWQPVRPMRFHMCDNNRVITAQLCTVTVALLGADEYMTWISHGAEPPPSPGNCTR